MSTAEVILIVIGMLCLTAIILVVIFVLAFRGTFKDISSDDLRRRRDQR